MKKILIFSAFTIILLSMAYFALAHNTQDIAVKSKPDANAMKTEPTEEQVANEQDVLFTVNSEVALKHRFSTIDEFNNSNVVDAIVKGRISNIEYVYIGHVAYSILTVDVLKSYKGNTAKTIKVYEDGGYVKIKDMLDDLRAHFDVNSLSTEQIENGVVDVKFFNAPHATVGQQVILYLSQNTDFRRDSFSITSSLYGKFTLDKTDGKYKRLPLDPKEYSATDVANWEASILEAELENKLSKTK